MKLRLNKGTILTTAFALVICFFVCIAALSPTIHGFGGGRANFTPFQKGFTYLKWGSQFSEHADRSFSTLKETGTEWVSFVPIYYMDTIDSLTMYRHPILSPTDKELRTSMEKAKQAGFKILLKPHIDVMIDPWKDQWSDKEAWLAQYRAFVDRYPISKTEQATDPENQNWFRRLFQWRGYIHPASNSDVKTWFKEYANFILHFAEMAEQLKVDEFCIGTEFEKMKGYTAEWTALIQKIRKVYHGPLLYDTNHGTIEDVGFWSSLDYIGVSAYYPLAEQPEASTDEMRAMLTATLDDIEQTVKKLEKKYRRPFPVLFSEAGYTDFRGTAVTPWDFLLTHGISQQEQADAYRVSLDLYPRRSWLKGVFFWRWSVEPEDAYFDYDHYSPYGKPAEQEIRNAWGKGRFHFPHTKGPL